MANAPELAPCPFCGGTIIVAATKNSGDLKTARHPLGTCILAGESWWFVSRFIGPWNTRATPPAAVIEAMERALRHADQVSRDLGWHRIYDETGSALAKLEAWRAGK